jgi:uncharacterized protein YprB with RNaseH-like and TPR domain
MKGNLRSRLQLIRELDGRKGAAGPSAVTAQAAAATAAQPAPQPLAASGAFPPSLPGWESAGFLAAKRTVVKAFPHAMPSMTGPSAVGLSATGLPAAGMPPTVLPRAFPRSLGIVAPDFFTYTADPATEGKALPQDLLFFDLETTGLSSGAGTVAFLAAFGRFVPAGPEYALQVDQYLLLDYPGEGDFLEAVLKEFTGRAAASVDGGNTVSGASAETRRPPLVVTYNGKTFDAQMLKTRCLMNAITPPEYHHADLLHPARRLWKRVLPSCAQASIETAVLGLDRTGDIPGSEAPDIWFDFLKTGRTEALLGICDHNLKDIYGLARLMAALYEIAASPLEALEKYRYDAERLALRWRSRMEAALTASEFETGTQLLGYAANQGWRKALLVRMIDAEWRRKDPAKALAFVEEALALDSVLSVSETDKIPVTSRIPLPPDFRDSLLHRRERLVRKTGKRRDLPAD